MSIKMTVTFEAGDLEGLVEAVMDLAASLKDTPAGPPTASFLPPKRSFSLSTGGWKYEADAKTSE